MPKKRCASKQTPTASTPEGELRRHLAGLGIQSVDAYRAWCRENGFGPSLNKSWQERRDEIARARRLRAGESARHALLDHAHALGLATMEEYRAWCVAHGFGVGERKPREQLKRELALATRERATSSLVRAKTMERRPADALRALRAGEMDEDSLTAPLLRAAARGFAAAASAPDVAEAFLRLLLHVLPRADLCGLDPVIVALGPQPGNTYIEGLLALARHRNAWTREPEQWKPKSRSAGRQFASLARHLLARYTVPEFMDAAWFMGDTEEAGRAQGWFIHIGIGRNIRTADVPVHLTKRAAHHFLLAPRCLSIVGALRWGQIHGLGGDDYLCRAVIGTRLGEIQPEEPFWAGFLHFLVNNPMLDRACIGPMADYIHHRKFEPQEHVADDGSTDCRPPDPGFSLKGRTAIALWRLVEAWHVELARETRKPALTWPASGFAPFVLEERDDDSGEMVRWTVLELLSREELVEEGREMRHCVASYARSCHCGRCSIWSVRMGDVRSDASRRVMTVEVHNGRRCIVQARGRCNRGPGDRRISERLKKAPRVLKLWAAQAGLTVPAYALS